MIHKYYQNYLDLIWNLLIIHSLKFDDGVSFMKGGLYYSDIITTVSNSYANEIQTPEYGQRLDGCIKRESICNKRNNKWYRL